MNTLSRFDIIVNESTLMGGWGWTYKVLSFYYVFI